MSISSLRDATISVISSSKILFNDPGDEVIKEQLNFGMSKVAESIKSIVYTVKSLISQGTEKTMTVKIEQPSTLTPPPPTSENAMNDVLEQTPPVQTQVGPTEAEKRAKAIREKLKEKQAQEEKKEEESRLKEKDLLAKLNTEYERLIKLSETQTLDKKQKEQLKKLEKALKKENLKKAKADKKAEKGKKLTKRKESEGEVDKEEKIYRELIERIFSTLADKYKKFAEEYKNQSPDAKAKIKEKVASDIKSAVASLSAIVTPSMLVYICY